MDRPAWDYGCAAVCKVAHPGVLVLEVHGLVTEAVFAHLRRDLREAAPDFDGNGVVLDFQAAMLVGLRLDELLLPQPQSRVDGMAVALLAREGDDIALARLAELCDAAAEEGRVNAVFTDSSRACAWARARGRALALAQ